MSRKTDLTSMTVSLPASQKAYVKAQAAAAGCSTPSEYVRRLFHADQKSREQEELERRLLEGLDSPAREMTSEDWQALRRALRAKLTQRRKAQWNGPHGGEGDLATPRGGRSHRGLPLHRADSPDAAERLLDAVEDAVRLLLENPGAGRQREFRSPGAQGVRSWVVKGLPDYLLFYRSEGEDLEIVRFLHGARDLMRLLEDEP